MDKSVKRRSLLTVLIAVLLVLSIVGAALMFTHLSASASGDVSKWDGDLIAAGWGDETVTAPDEYKVTYENGSAGKVSKIEIGSAAAFAWFAHEVYKDGGDGVTEGNGTYYLDDAVVTLTTDIDLDNKMWIPIGRTGREYALGQSYKRSRFSGTFDGGNHTIYNLSTEKLVESFKCIPAAGSGTAEQYYNEYTYEGNKNYTNKTAKIPVTLRDQTEYSYGLFALAYNLTVKNLNVVGVDIDISEMQLGGSKPVIPDSVGVIAGFATGNVTIDNCTIGSTDPKFANSITLDKDDSGCAGGLIGRLYAMDGTGTGGASTRYLITNCVNYVNFKTPADKLKIGGMVGQINYGLSSKIEGCVNYGDINGGRYLGGIVGFWQPNKNGQTATFSMIDCDNFGNVITMSTASDAQVAGLANVYRSKPSLRLVVDGCNNYGNVGGTNFVGGLLGTIFGDSIPVYTSLTNNYNYGDVYCYGTGAGYGVSGSGALLYQKTFAGGYVAFMNAGYGSNKLIVTGGNYGTVYGTADYIGSTLSRGSENATNRNDDGYFLLEVGKVVNKTKEEMAQIKMPDSEYSSAVHKRYSEVVSRKVKEEGEYEGEYLVDANTGAFTYEYEYTDETFAYADAEHTTIIGVVSGATTVTIPNTVTTIAHAALAGNKAIQAVKFAEGTAITSIEDAAFAGCSNLNNVVLPANAANIKLGLCVFSNTRADAGVFLIAGSSAAYRALSDNEMWAQSGGVLTHVVTIAYILDGTKLEADQERLHGQSYSFAKEGDEWKSVENTFGPVGHQDKVWYTSADRAYVVTNQNINNLLLADGDTITLYAYTEGDGSKVFIPRADLVYDGKTYTAQELNLLLHTLSDRIDPSMRVKINGSADGVIHDAGDYTISVEVPEDKTYTFTITIAPAVLDLSNIQNLEWIISDTNAELMSSTLYIYTYSDADSANSGKEYPTNEILTDAQIKSLKLNSGYEVRTVDYSVARSRGGETDDQKRVTITINGVGYEIDYKDEGTYTHSATAVGAYQAKAELTAGTNYVFTTGTISTPRGMTIEVSGNGTTATVIKNWYIVDFSNALIIPGSDVPYTVADRTYRDSTEAVAPGLAYGQAADAITMHLTHNVIGVIGDASGFTVNQFNQYINSAMPAGTYTLEIVVASVTTQELSNGSPITVVHSGFTETLTFTVAKKALPNESGMLDAIHTAIKGQTFTLDASGSIMDTAAVSAALNAYTALTVNDSREGTIWESYGDYYSTQFAIEYNLLRLHTDEYSATMANTLTPDTYTVYYRIAAKNYYSSIENLASNVTRYDYTFELVRYHVLTEDEMPVIDSGLVYSGERQVPTVTIASNNLYRIIWDDRDDYINGGSHKVSFELNDPTHYRWPGNENVIGGKTIERTFTIAQADNAFDVLSMLGWEYDTFDSKTNTIRAAVRYLDSGKSITFYVTKQGESVALDGLGSFTVNSLDRITDSNVINKLNLLVSGNYTLHARVEATNNYKAIEQEVDFSITKARNSWLIDEDHDLELPSWIVGQWNEEDNPIIVSAAHGDVNIKITDIDGNEYYIYENGEVKLNDLNKCKVGKYLLTAWVEESPEFAELAPRTFTIEVFAKPGLPWWATLIAVVGALGVAALIIFILWKKGVFQILTEKIVVALRTRASVEATIASVRAAKRMEEGKKSVADAKRRERLEKLRQKAKEQREMSPEDRAAMLEAKAKADAERAEKFRTRSESALAKAAKMRKDEPRPAEEAPETKQPEQTEAPVAESQPETEVPGTPDTPTEE